MKNLVFIIVLLSSMNIFAQKVDHLDSKYLTALIYLKTNSNVNNEIKKFRQHWLKKEKNRENTEDFNLSKYVSYLPVPTLKKIVNSHNIIEIDKNEHRIKYYFDMYENELFNELFPKNQSKIYLLFSKPIDNYLVAEFMINSTGEEIDLSLNKQGPAMHVLFIFGENGIVKDAYIASSYYN